MGRNCTLVLAIDPTSRGFAYAAFEGSHRLVDWGLVHARADKQPTCLRRISKLFDWLQPDVVVLEEIAGSRRGVRVRELLTLIAELTAEEPIPLSRVSRNDVREVFAAVNARTKDQIASALADRFPELGHRLPPKRRPWMSEPERMGIFDAVAFAMVYFERNSGTGSTADHDPRKKDC